MALNSPRSVGLALILLSGMMLAGGCQQQSGVVERLPAANYNGPLVPAPPPPVAPPVVKPPAPTPVVRAPAPEVKKPPAPALGVPREWVPAVAKADGNWRWIVIHHSATPTGGAAAFDRMHRQKGWDELGYHFVIGNGTDTRDGQVEVGSRWPKQKHGAHAKTPSNEYNMYGIGICLVGNFDVEHPSPAQRASLAKLVAYLQKTYHIPSDCVIAHGSTKATDCPGRNVHIAEIRQSAARLLAAAGENPEIYAAKRPEGELLVDRAR